MRPGQLRQSDRPQNGDDTWDVDKAVTLIRGARLGGQWETGLDQAHGIPPVGR